MRLKILKNKMLMLRYENELCQRYLLLKLMPILAIYKNAVHREHSVDGTRDVVKTTIFEVEA